MESKKYKLCLIDKYEKSEVQPIDLNGREYGDTLCTYEEEGECYYAIYENIGDEHDEDWEEYAWYGTDFEKARKEYKKLVRREQ